MASEAQRGVGVETYTPLPLGTLFSERMAPPGHDFNILPFKYSVRVHYAGTFAVAAATRNDALDRLTAYGNEHPWAHIGRPSEMLPGFVTVERLALDEAVRLGIGESRHTGCPVVPTSVLTHPWEHPERSTPLLPSSPSGRQLRLGFVISA